ncbi:MAG: hypothetical protein JWM34_1440 [Ilumatobacteraceae bacterium]|nr:hypothetical protein [Ilumatobacteraceae bacterium]
MWQIETHRGSAAAFHLCELPSPPVPTVWWFEVQSPAIVLGSAQPIEHLDRDACARLGIDIVRRRSGGGAVLLMPGDALWVDVVLPVDDARWTADVGRSAWWLGEVWRDALSSVGIPAGETAVHRGALVRTAWSDRVCFAGRGGGEVVSGDRKIVGISQRRTRLAARFQCALYLHWRPEQHVPLFSEPHPDVEELSHAVQEVDVETSAMMTAFAAALERSS